ncbi:hypothetical protein Q427_08190 [Halomonas sp. BC04]|nr:hypothetical protein Q427_08190 [Halomonas sp. BC04]
MVGRNGGTFVSKQLVYAYAMWVSPKFHLNATRADDTLQTQGIAVADHAADDLLINQIDALHLLREGTGSCPAATS